MTSERGPMNADSDLGDAVDSEMGPPESTSVSGSTYGSGLSSTTTSGAGLSSGSGMSSSTTSSTSSMSGSSGMTDGGSGDHLKDATSRVASKVSDTIGQEVDTRTSAGFDRAGSMLDHVADAMDQAGDKLRPEEAPVADVAKAAAGQLRGAADYLRNTDMESLLSNAEDFARRQPAIFLGGALAIGLMASRFLKASPVHDQGSRYATGGSRFSAGMSSGYRAYGGYRSSMGSSMGGSGMGSSSTTSPGAGMGGTASLGRGGSDDRA